MVGFSLLLQDGIIFFSAFIFLNAGILFLVKWNASKVARKQLRDFGFDPNKKIKVRYSGTTHGYATVTLAIPVKAYLYISEKFIFLTPTPGSFLGVLYGGSLPLVITKNVDEVSAKTKVKNSIVPEKMTLLKGHTLRVSYHTPGMMGKNENVIKIKILDSDKYNEWDIIKSWSIPISENPGI